MKRLLTASLAVLMIAGSAGAASAQYRDHNNNGRYDQRDRAYEAGRRDQARAEDRRDARQDRRDYRRWAKGQRLDQRYRGNGYYVSDYRRHGLRQPPRGYPWQRVDNQFLLTAVATGVITSVILANR